MEPTLPPDLPDVPAYADPHQDAIAPSEAEAVIGNAILRAFQADGRVFRLTDRNGFAGHYKMVPTGEAALFVKVTGVQRRAYLDMVDDFVDNLDADTEAVRRVGFAAVNGHAAFAYPFVEGRRPKQTEPDMERIGRAVAALHPALKSHGDGAIVRQRAKDFLGYLETVAARTVDRPAAGFPHAARSCLRARRQCLDAYPDHAGAQVLHGDLNYGNVLMRADDGKAVLLDFENVVRSYGPVELDLIFAMERLCFAPSTEPETSLQLATAFLAGYAGSAPTPNVGDQEIADVMEAHALRALATLAAMMEEGRSPPAGEMDKFISLYNDRTRKAAILAAAFAQTQAAKPAKEVSQAHAS